MELGDIRQQSKHAKWNNLITHMSKLLNYPVELRWAAERHSAVIKAIVLDKPKELQQ